MNGNYEKFKTLLRELFQLDRSDLDFGIYRIMNQKHAEIVRFLDNDLLPQVKQAFKASQAGSRAAVEADLQDAVEQAKKLGIEPDSVPRVKELRAKYGEAVDVTALENEVFSDLYNFFRRYYNEGDFLSLRRYKEGVYAIPYEGEEVKLHWANQDQYYIKSSENLRDYAFKVSGGKRVHFKVVEVDAEKNNVQVETAKDRRFMLAAGNPLAEEGGDLFIHFVHQPDPSKRRQDAINKETLETMLGTGQMAEALTPVIRAVSIKWLAVLSTPAPTEKHPNRTVLEKHLADFTARNTFDYFIHKDLDKFLRRELDFFIKNEVLHIDDIEDESAQRVEQKVLNKIRAIRRIAIKLIQFLAQLEDFQKKLWLKKKFVVETNYCITLDRVPEALFPEIAANDAQRDEWVRLFAIDEIKGDLGRQGFSTPLKAQFLKENLFLVLDTMFFECEFKDKLLASIENLDERSDGLLVHSENFQALKTLTPRFAGQIQCVHIDPPYNTQTSGFLYPNTYQHSSWLAMMAQVTAASVEYLTEDGSFVCHIDENEYERLHLLLDDIAPPSAGTMIWDKKNPMLGREGLATQHEYIIWRTKVRGSLYLRNAKFKLIMEKAKEIIARHGGVTEGSRSEFSKWITNEPGFSGGERAYRNLNDDGRVYQSVGMAAPEYRTDPKFHTPLLHPVTKKPCPVPVAGWSRAPETIKNLMQNNEVIFGATEETQPRLKVFVTNDSQRQMSSVVQESGRGKNDIERFGLDFPYCHPVSLYVEILGGGASGEKSIVLDFFAGSGTNGHATITLNREEGTHRKYILVEIGSHFDTVLKPRIQKVVYSKDWKDGKPVSREGSSHMFKYIRLESYEDALNNLELRRTTDQDDLLRKHAEFRESYTLSYMLDVESRDSLLNIRRFDDPFNYRLKIATGSGGESKPVTVDLVETFNYLIGLTVKHVDTIRGVKVVEGKSPQGDRVLVLWRNVAEMDNDQLDKWFRRQKYNTQDMEYDVVYVNGDNNLENLRRSDQTWKVRLIEEEFLRLMFECKDV